MEVRMAKLRWWLLSLIAWLCLFFNIEHIDFYGGTHVALPGLTYLLGFVAAGLPFLLNTRRYSFVIMGAPLLALFALQVALMPEELIRGIQKYITFTAAIFLIGTLYLARRAVESLHQFEEAVEMVTLPDKTNALLDLQSAQAQIENEMLRSRRTQRPLTLIMLQADIATLKQTSHEFVQEIQRAMTERYMLAVSARLLARTLRRTDILIETGHPGRLILIAPETSEDTAAAIGHRIEQQLRESLGIDTNFATASFPEQSLTFESLMLTAEERLRNDHEPHDVQATDTKSTTASPQTKRAPSQAP
jgi:GGDEF domain-containing protein